MIRDIENLKENLKRGTISYFSLTPEEVTAVRESLENEISVERNEIEDIKSKIEEEKRKIENRR